MKNPMDLPAVQAAKLVVREVAEKKDGKPTGKTVKSQVKPDEVFACRVRDGEVTVVTTAGEKLFGILPEQAEK